ncbi:MAG: hypothetical protein ACRDNZ_02870 [Streptosporangiaceae bacterium]
MTAVRAAGRAAVRAGALAGVAAGLLTACSAQPQPIGHPVSPALAALAGSWRLTTSQETILLLVRRDATFSDEFAVLLPQGQGKKPMPITIQGRGRVTWLSGNRYRFLHTSFNGRSYPAGKAAGDDYTADLSAGGQELSFQTGGILMTLQRSS